MKICESCKILFHEQVMSCPECRLELMEVSLNEALDLMEQKAFRQYMSGPTQKKLAQDHIQYHIGCYLANRSLFLAFDLFKNRLKKGPRTKTFFIAPVNLTAIINLPWFLFNVINSNLFHLQYTEYCPRCDAKYIRGHHPPEECAYNTEFFRILDDIANGTIMRRRGLYADHAQEKLRNGQRSAYAELFLRPVRLEIFWDFASILFTVIFWLYVAVYVSFPMAQVLIQKLQHLEAYEWTFLTLR